ncbi:MAG: hypothetical protein RSF67_03440, partial [Clostridia bacterium]
NESFNVTGELYNDNNELLDTVLTKGEIGITNVISFNTVNYELGNYKLVLRCVSVDNANKTSEEDAILDIKLIEEENFKIWGTSGAGLNTLLADLNARSNNSSDTVWHNTIKNHSEISVDLFNTNGYVSGFLPFTNSLTLRGESYGILKYVPFEDTNMVEDFSINFLYKAYNNGDPKACVVSCAQYSVNTGELNYGFEINASEISVKTVNNSVNATVAEDSWINCCIVFERVEDKIIHTGDTNFTLYANYFIKIYINGVLSKANYVAADSAYQLLNNIYIGCRANNVAGNIVLSNYAHCEIKNIRIYDIRLSDNQIVYNYISDDYWQNPIYEYNQSGNIISIKGYDIQKQKDLRELNSYDENGNFIFDLANKETCPLPILRVSFYDDTTGQEFYYHTRTTSWEGKDFNKKFQCKITYINKYDNIELIDIDAFISLQGTSSGEYLSKNYEISFGEDTSVQPAIPILMTPTEDWLPENSFTIKTNMMDSSHANNIGCGSFVNNYLYDNKLPPMISTSANPNAYADKVKYSLDGFPIHVGITFTGSKENYMGVHTFNMGRYSFFNLGLRAFKTLEFKNKNRNIGLVESYTENTAGIYGQSCAFEISTSNNLGSPAFRQYSDPWMNLFIQRYPITERSYLPNTKLKYLIQNTVKDIALSTQSGGIPELNLDGTPVVDNKGNIVYLPTTGKPFEEIVEMDRNFCNDYLLFAYIVGLSDSLGKNMMIKSWGKELNDNEDRFHWYPTYYDMDTCLGVSNDGQLDKLRCGPGMDLSSFKDGSFESGQNVYVEGTGENTSYVGLGYGTYNLSNSLLWIQFMKDHRFNPGSKSVNMNERYKYLRLPKSDGSDASFSVNNIFKTFANVIDKIGASFYNQDAKIKYLQLEEVTDDIGNVIGASYFYVKNFLNGKREAYTKQWISQRFKYCDSIFNLSLVEVPDNTVAKNIPMRFNSGTSQVIFPKLYIKTYSPMFPTLFWSGLDTNSARSKMLTGDTLNGKSGEGIFAGQITASNQSSVLTNAPDIEYIKNLKECNPSRLELSNATSLRELDLSNKSSIEYLDVQTCKSMKTLNLSNCINLRGTDGMLNVSGCESLEYLDISNTLISNIVLSTGDTPKVVLHTFKANNCNITSVNFKGQSYLKNVELSECKSLTDLTFDGCTSLRNLNCNGFYISKLIIKDCYALETLELSNCSKLIELSVSNCPNLKNINLSNSVSPENSAGCKIDLIGAYNLEDINISNSYITKLYFNANLKSLKRLNISNSSFNSTTFGGEDSVINGLPLVDLSKQGDLENCYFTKNSAVQNVIFNDMYLTDSSSNFEGCNSLSYVKGNIHFKGKIDSTFAYSSNLLFDDITFIDNGITEANTIFQGCKRLTYDQAIDFINNSTDVISYNSTFNNTSITNVSIIDNIFQNHTKLLYLNNMFSNCKNLRSTLSAEFFKSCGNVIKTDKMFSGSGIIDINNDILKPLVNLETCDEMFADCSNLLSILENGENLFRYNTKVQNLISVFKGCYKMTIVLPGGDDYNQEEVPGEGPAVLFKYNNFLIIILIPIILKLNQSYFDQFSYE